MYTNSQPKMFNCECKADVDEMRQLYHNLLQDFKKMKLEQNKKSRSLGDKFAENVSLMGLTEAIKAKHKTAKLLWMLVFFFCIAAATYFVYKIFDEYASNPTATKVKLTRQSSYSYPPLVFCVDTWLNYKKAQRMGLTKEAVHYALSYLTHYPNKIVHRSNSSTAKNEFEKVYSKYKFKSLDHFFDSISLNAVRLPYDDDDEARVYQDHIQVIGPSLGDKLLPKLIIEQSVCYKIELYEDDGKLRELNELLVRVPDLSLGVAKKSSYWKLYVNPSLKQKIQSTTFLSIRRDYTHVIKITSTYYRIINTYREPCVEPNDPQRTNYSAISCGLDCFSEVIKSEVLCTAFNYEIDPKPNLAISRYCNPYYMHEWYDQVTKIDNNSMGTGWKNFDKCTEQCLPECNVWKYDTSIDFHVSSELQNTDDTAKKNISVTKLIFVNGDVAAGGILKFTEVYTYSFETLVGNIGGTCGIWIGASILTMIQLFSFCSKHCATSGKRRFFGKKPTRRRRFPFD